MLSSVPVRRAVLGIVWACVAGGLACAQEGSEVVFEPMTDCSDGVWEWAQALSVLLLCYGHWKGLGAALALFGEKQGRFGVRWMWPSAMAVLFVGFYVGVNGEGNPLALLGFLNFPGFACTGLGLDAFGIHGVSGAVVGAGAIWLESFGLVRVALCVRELRGNTLLRIDLSGPSTLR